MSKKKTWIKVKRGLLDPKHRKALGIRVWLYMHMLDIVDWETGIIDEWRDKDAAGDLDMPWRTIQGQRQQLENDGYIICEQTFQCLRITIHKWINPRKYSGEVLNPHGTESSVPATHGTEVPVPAISGGNRDKEKSHGTEHGTQHPTIELRTPIKGTLTHTTDSQLKDSRTNNVRARNSYDSIRKALEEQFIESSSLKSPLVNTEKQKRSAGELWWAPLREIAVLANWNELSGQSLIDRTVQQMRKDKLTISSPKSILNVAKSIVAEGIGSMSGAREFLDELRRS